MDAEVGTKEGGSGKFSGLALSGSSGFELGRAEE